MATMVEQLPGVGGRTPTFAYDWDKWLNGKSWHLKRGVDYKVATTAIRAYAYRVAGARGLKVKTVRDPDGQGISLIGMIVVAGPPVGLVESQVPCYCPASAKAHVHEEAVEEPAAEAA